MHIEKTKEYLSKGLAAITLLFISFLIVMQSPMNPIWKLETGTDSSVFKYVALVMSKGGMPYKDTFDHKGPLLYLINYFGQMISYYRGVWFLELISMFVFVFASYKISRLFCKRTVSILIVALICASFSEYFEGGNFTEEYALPFISVALFIYLDFLFNEKISKIRLLVCGAAMACVCLLRINMIGMWIVFSIAVLVKDIRLKQKQWLQFIVYFLLGAVIVTTPIMIWLLVNGAFPDFVQDYILFNLKYIEDENRANFLNKFDAFMEFLEYGLTITTIPILIYLCKEGKDVFVNVTYIIYLVVNIMLTIMSGMSYGHYGMVLIPMLIYPYARIFTHQRREKIPSFSAMVLSIFLLTMVFNPWKEIIRGNMEKFYNASKGEEASLTEYYLDQYDILDIIRQNTTENDKIIVLGNKDIWYVLSERLAASKYSYQTPIASVNEEIMNEFLDDMNREKPIMVLDAKKSKRLFPNKKEYELLASTDALDVYKLKEDVTK